MQDNSSNQSMNAIVLDGEQRAALAVTRSLGRRGIRVAVGSYVNPCLSSSSRYCADSFVYPSPHNDPAGFRRALMEFILKSRPAILFPVTDISLSEVLLHRCELPEGILLPFDSYSSYCELSDKANLFRVARELKVPLPGTLLSTDYENQEVILQNAGKMGFPLVVKPSLSKVRTISGWSDAKVQYAKNPDNLRQILSLEIFNKHPFLIQKRIIGPGIGIFLLMKDGVVIAKFAHKRIREKPPSGGVSVLSESIEIPRDAGDSAVKILENIRWTGVAMVEFKVDQEEKIAKLLEVNARFWGSLQLSISAGVDFPYMLYCLAKGEKNEHIREYTVGLRSRWELGDLDHLLIRLFKNPTSSNIPNNQPRRSTVLKEFMSDFFRPSVRNEVLQAGDVRPFFHELKNYVRHFLR
jgi:predicted ATP-grasp superfamily ATP-dependent carboligase